LLEQINDIYLNREHQDLALGWMQQPIMSVNVSCATMLSLSHIDRFIVNLKRCKKGRPSTSNTFIARHNGAVHRSLTSKVLQYFN